MASIAMLNFSETICFLKLGHTIFLRHWFFKEGLSPVPGSIRRQRSEGWRPKTSAELFSQRSHANGSANPSWYSTCQRADYLCNKRTCFVSHTLSNDLTIVYLEKPTDSCYFPYNLIAKNESTFRIVSGVSHRFHLDVHLSVEIPLVIGLQHGLWHGSKPINY